MTEKYKTYSITLTMADGSKHKIPIAVPYGEKGDKGERGEPFTYKDFTAEQLAALKGGKGDKGDKGDKGEKGADGKDGVDGKDGTNGLDGYTPVYGLDYFTTSQKQEMVNDVLSMIPIYDGEVVSV